MDKTEQILQAAKEGAKKYFDEQVSLLTKFLSRGAQNVTELRAKRN